MENRTLHRNLDQAQDALARLRFFAIRDDHPAAEAAARELAWAARGILRSFPELDRAAIDLTERSHVSDS